MKTVIGFTGSSIWITLAGSRPSPEMIAAGYQDFADRWGPIIDVFDQVGVRFAHEVHPSEIAYDYSTTRRALDAMGNREGFGLNFDPAASSGRTSTPWVFSPTIRRASTTSTARSPTVRHLDGRNGRLSSHLPFGDLRRGWDFVSVGHGEVPWEHVFRKLNEIGYRGPSRSSGKTPAWTGSSVRPRRWPSSGANFNFNPPAAALDARLQHVRRSPTRQVS